MEELKAILNIIKTTTLDENDSVSKLMKLWCKKELLSLKLKNKQNKTIVNEIIKTLNIDKYKVTKEDTIESLCRMTIYGDNYVTIIKNNKKLEVTRELQDKTEIIYSTDDDKNFHGVITWLYNELGNVVFKVKIKTNDLNPIDYKELKEFTLLLDYLITKEKHKDFLYKLEKRANDKLNNLKDLTNNNFIKTFY